VLPAEHLFDLAGLHFPIEDVEGLRELRVDRLAGLRPLDEHTEIVALLLQRSTEVAVLFEAPAALQDFLRLRLVLPEIRRGGFGFELGQFLIGAGGLKDSSADRRRVG
jgi:hypothetical protein